MAALGASSVLVTVLVTNLSEDVPMLVIILDVVGTIVLVVVLVVVVDVVLVVVVLVVVVVVTVVVVVVVVLSLIGLRALTDCLIGQGVAENNESRQRRAECVVGMMMTRPSVRPIELLVSGLSCFTSPS